MIQAGAIIVSMSEPLVPATEDLLARYGAVLTDLGGAHGVTGLRHGGPGILVADVEVGRTLMDLALFELEAESLLGAAVAVVASDAPAAARLAGMPLRATSPA